MSWPAQAAARKLAEETGLALADMIGIHLATTSSSKAPNPARRRGEEFCNRVH